MVHSIPVSESEVEASLWRLFFNSTLTVDASFIVSWVDWNTGWNTGLLHIFDRTTYNIVNYDAPECNVADLAEATPTMLAAARLSSTRTTLLKPAADTAKESRLALHLSGA